MNEKQTCFVCEDDFVVELVEGKPAPTTCPMCSGIPQTVFDELKGAKGDGNE